LRLDLLIKEDQNIILVECKKDKSLSKKRLQHIKLIHYVCSVNKIIPKMSIQDLPPSYVSVQRDSQKPISERS